MASDTGGGLGTPQLQRLVSFRSNAEGSTSFSASIPRVSRGHVVEQGCYWVPHPSKVYILVIVRRIEGDRCWATCVEDNREVELDVRGPFFPINTGTVDDMTALPHLHEAGVLHNLEERAKLQHQNPYTYVSNVLIAVNPLRKIPDPSLESFRERSLVAGPPHPYGIAELAYKQLTMPSAEKRNQSIVISGESGSGKTETAKIVLRYLCWRSTSAAHNPSAVPGSSGPRLSFVANQPPPPPTTSSLSAMVLKNMPVAAHGADGSAGAQNRRAVAAFPASSLDRRLLDSTPIIEAFGNAKTLRNGNSSRVGKFMKLYYDSADNYKLVSAVIETYLLEKSRVVSVCEGERNFHIFYQLIAGAPDKKRWRLKQLESYKYIMQSSEVEVEDMNDAENFQILCKCMTSVGVSHSEQDMIFRLISAVLSLGNVDFQSQDTASEGAVAAVDESYTVDLAAELLGVKRDGLEFILLNRRLSILADNDQAAAAPSDAPATNVRASIYAPQPEAVSRRRHSQYNIRRDVVQANYARDSMAKTIYQRIFDWVVKKVGDSLQQTTVASNSTSHLNFIAVLDIFGFESFEVNRLEQLLINFANEWLQFTFSRAIFVAEQELYRSEGFELPSAVSLSNHACLDLIYNLPNSIINTLDSVCKAPEPSDERFNSIIHREHEDNSEFLKPHLKNKKTTFVIRHYAQPVQYTVGTFVSKNTETALPELSELLLSSSFCSPGSFCNALFDLETPLTSGYVDDVPHYSIRLSEDEISVEPDAPPSTPSASLSRAGGASSILQSLDAIKSKTSNVKKAVKEPVDLNARPSLTDSSAIVASGARIGYQRKKRSNLTMASLFAQQIGQLCTVLESTSCHFVRCVKPNSAMMVGKFDRRYVVDQLRCLGVIQTCEVLRLNMPFRLTYQQLEDMYRGFLFPSPHPCVKRLSARAFALSLLWASEVPREMFALGNTRVFFHAGGLQHIYQICNIKAMQPSAVEALAARVTKHVVRQMWAKALCTTRVMVYFSQLFRKCRKQRVSCSKIQLSWQKYRSSPAFLRRLAIRKTWRIAIIRVLFQNKFLSDYKLIVEANLIRHRNEDQAMAEIQALRDAEEKRRQEATEAVRALHVRRATLASDPKLVAAAAAAAAAANAGDSAVAGPSNGMLPSILEGEEDEESRSMLAAASVALKEHDQAKIKSEMDVLVAASNLATVSVCLFRWTRIKLFRAFETWRYISLTIEMEAAVQPDFDAEVPVEVPVDAIVPDVDDIFATQSTSNVPATPTDAFASPKLTAQRSRPSLVMSPLQISSISLKVMPFNAEEGAEDAIVSLEDGGAKFKQLSVSASDMCYDCNERHVSFWCGSCQVLYCKICCQFVHGSSRIMRSHVPEVLKADVEGEKASSATPVSLSRSFRVSLDDSSSSSTSFLDLATSTPSMQQRRKSKRPSITSTFVKGTIDLQPIGEGIVSVSEKGKDPCAIKSCDKEACKGVSIRFCEFHYEEFRATMKIGADNDEQKTLQQQVALLKRQLQESGQQPVEFVELSVAREKMQAAVQKLMEGDEKAEKDVEKWDKAIRMNPEYQKEMEEKAKKWAEDQRPTMEQCRRKMRMIIPNDVTQTNVNKMIEEGVPKVIANRIWNKKALWLICMHADDIKRIHIVDLKSKYNPQGLDIVEMRACFASLPVEFELDSDGKKAEWRNNIRTKLEELTTKEEKSRLSALEKRNPCYKGFEDLAIYDPDSVIERAQIQKSTAFDATEKPDELVASSGGIRNIKGRLSEMMRPALCEGQLLVLDADGVAGKKLWVSLQATNKEKSRTLFAFESEAASKEYTATDSDGQSEHGSKGSTAPVFEIKLHHSHGVKAGPGNSRFILFDAPTEGSTSAETVVKTFEGERNRWTTALNEALKFVRDRHDKKLKKLQKEEEKNRAQESSTPSKDDSAGIAPSSSERPPNPLMAALAGRGAGGPDGGRGGGGNPLMAAIAGRGRGGADGGRGGGANPLMAAIAGRGAGGTEGGRGGGNPLMAAIAARGAAGGGGGGGGADAGRGDGGNPLMAAIAGRGRGGADGGRGGGANPLLAAIAGRGRGGASSSEGAGRKEMI